MGALQQRSNGSQASELRNRRLAGSESGLQSSSRSGMNRRGTKRLGTNRRGIATSLIIAAIVAFLLVGGGFYLFSIKGTTEVVINPILSEVRQGEFINNVLDQGEIQSSENIEIRCKVRARNGTVNVIEVAPEGTRVKAGDFLVRLDKTGFEKELEQQKIAVANAQTAVIQADAALKAAEASKMEYLEGIFIQNEKTIQNEINDANAAIQTAEQENLQALAVLEHSTKLQSKGFITKQQLNADQFSVRRSEINLRKAKLSLELGEKKLEVLRNITRAKELVRLTSDIEAAVVKFKNSQESFKVEEDKLAEILQQIENCSITVPEGVEGQIVFAKESGRGGQQEWVLEEGAAVRENQILMRLPNPNKMEVKALINEQSITSIRPGMPASIKVDALNNQVLKGVVTKINQYAESSGWMPSSIRKYACMVRIIDPPVVLKPGMNASVSIQSQYEQSALLTPVQTVYGVGDRKFCLVKKPDNQWETREIEIDGDNSREVLVKSGLKVGEQLVMNPGAYKSLMVLPESVAETKIDVPESAKQDAVAATAQGGDAAAGGRGRPGEGRGGAGGGSAGGGGAGGPPGGFDMSAMVQRMMDRYDTNSDGKIDASEQEGLEERARGMVSQADSNSDGEITKEEIEASTKRMMERMQNGGGGPGGGRGPN